MKKYELRENNATISTPVTFNKEMPISQVPQYLHDEVLHAINTSEKLSATQERLSENFGTNVTLLPRSYHNGFSMLIEFEVPFSVKAKSELLNTISDAIQASKDSVEEMFSTMVKYTTSKILVKNDSASVNIQVNLTDTEMFPQYFYCAMGFGSFFTNDSPELVQIPNALMRCAGKGMDFFDIAREVYVETHSQSPVTVCVRYFEGTPCFAISRSRN